MRVCVTHVCVLVVVVDVAVIVLVAAAIGFLFYFIFTLFFSKICFETLLGNKGWYCMLS